MQYHSPLCTKCWMTKNLSTPASVLRHWYKHFWCTLPLPPSIPSDAGQLKALNQKLALSSFDTWFHNSGCTNHHPPPSILYPNLAASTSTQWSHWIDTILALGTTHKWYIPSVNNNHYTPTEYMGTWSLSTPTSLAPSPMSAMHDLSPHWLINSHHIIHLSIGILSTHAWHPSTIIWLCVILQCSAPD